jgi:hypothetical protein
MPKKPLAVDEFRVTLRESGETPEGTPETIEAPTVTHLEEAIAATVSATWPWLTAKVEGTRTDK